MVSWIVSTLIITLFNVPVAEFRDVFKLFDKDGDGNISEKELGVVMSGLGKHLADDELHELFITADYSGMDFCTLDNWIYLKVIFFAHACITSLRNTFIVNCSPRNSNFQKKIKNCVPDNKWLYLSKRINWIFKEG